MFSTLSLRYFAAVTRCGSFRGAAEQLFVAPSAISRQVALLEEDLGAILFERGRGRQRLALTIAGESLMNYVINIENEGRRVRSDIEAQRGLRKGQVKFGATEPFPRIFLPKFLCDFNQEFPGISYAVTVLHGADLIEKLLADEIDAALLFNPPPTLGLHHNVEISLRTKLLVPKGHPLAEKKSVRIADCSEYGIAWPETPIAWRRHLDEIFARAKVRPRIVLTSNSYELLKNASIGGLSITVVNQPFAELRRDTSHRYISITDSYVSDSKLTLSTRAGRNLSKASLSFIDRMQVELQKASRL